MLLLYKLPSGEMTHFHKQCNNPLAVIVGKSYYRGPSIHGHELADHLVMADAERMSLEPPQGGSSFANEDGLVDAIVAPPNDKISFNRDMPGAKDLADVIARGLSATHFGRQVPPPQGADIPIRTVRDGTGYGYDVGLYPSGKSEDMVSGATNRQLAQMRRNLSLNLLASGWKRSDDTGLPSPGVVLRHPLGHKDFWDDNRGYSEIGALARMPDVEAGEPDWLINGNFRYGPPIGYPVITPTDRLVHTPRVGVDSHIGEPFLRGLGLGSRAYTLADKLLQRSGGPPLSTLGHSNQANRMWRRLVGEGLATEGHMEEQFQFKPRPFKKSSGRREDMLELTADMSPAFARGDMGPDDGFQNPAPVVLYPRELPFKFNPNLPKAIPLSELLHFSRHTRDINARRPEMLLTASYATKPFQVGVYQDDKGMRMIEDASPTGMKVLQRTVANQFLRGAGYVPGPLRHPLGHKDFWSEEDYKNAVYSGLMVMTPHERGSEWPGLEGNWARVGTFSTGAGTVRYPGEAGYPEAMKIDSNLEPAFRGLGIGSRAYRHMDSLIQRSGGHPLVTFGHSDAANQMWRKLVRDGYANDNSERGFPNSAYTRRLFSFKPVGKSMRAMLNV